MDDIQTLKDKEKEFGEDFEHSEIESQPKEKFDLTSGDGWWCGAILIALGVFFLFRPFGLFFANWWALFLVVPGLIKIGRALNDHSWQQHLPGGLFMVMIGSIFLFGLSWAVFWPMILLFFGVMALTAARR